MQLLRCSNCRSFEQVLWPKTARLAHFLIVAPTGVRL